jgi:hypothetical protein
MKNLFILSFIALLFLNYNAPGQSTRLILAEEFTQASSPPDAAQNPAFNALLNANPTKVCAIKYHTSWPGVDPMNATTQAIVNSRVTYYSINSVPYALMDGTAQTGASYTGAPANWSQTKINNRDAVTSPYTLTLNHTVDLVNDSIHITGNIACTQAVTGTLVLHVVLVERQIEFCIAPGTNGETIFTGVMQSMIPNSGGTSLTGSWNIGQQQPFSFDVKIPNYIYSKAELAVVAFVQNNATKEVLQSAYSAPHSLTTDVILSCTAITNVSLINCSGVTPAVTFKNAGTTNLTSADIVYNVDGINSVTQSWSGSLAPGLSTTVSLPTLNPAAGSHVLNVSVSNPNDHNIYRQSASQNFSISPGPGTAPPLNQSFSSVIFPPAGWIINNPDNGVTWTRNAAGLNGAGSAKIDFWSSTNGSVDELILPNINLGSSSQASFDFDVAYCQYNTSINDKMEVFYSTDCGQNWISIFNQAGSVLASGNAPTTSAFTPTTASQWHHKTASLQGALGSNNVFLKFKATSAYGNNAYIDNINISHTPGCIVPAFTVFPGSTSVSASNGSCLASVNYTVTTNDPQATISHVFSGATTGSGNGTGSGQMFAGGITNVSITAVNSCNSVTNSFDITVISLLDDSNACTIDACNLLTGAISHTPVNTDDGNVCTTDRCDPLTGISSHTPVNIEDGNICTNDGCDPVTGIFNTPVDVDDQNACTFDECDYSTGAILHTPLNIDDANACTNDHCDILTGLITHIPALTDDQNACTTDACDIATGLISHTVINTDDGIAFTEDGCDPVTGVYHHPVFNVKLFLQGYYTGNGMMDNSGVGGTLYLLGLSPNQTDVDTIEVLFYDTHGNNDVLSSKGILQTDGTARISFSTTLAGNYYLHVRHRNTIETWSSSLISLGTTNTYDFTDLQSKAYGSNQVITSDQNYYAMFSGDVTNATSDPGIQNGFIELTDYNLVENYMNLILCGFNSSDITGDGIVESQDYLIVTNNYNASIMIVRP